MELVGLEVALRDSVSDFINTAPWALPLLTASEMEHQSCQCCSQMRVWAGLIGSFREELAGLGVDHLSSDCRRE